MGMTERSGEYIVGTPEGCIKVRDAKRLGKLDGVHILECTVDEGEAIYFPNMWWHATLNLDESVFISSFVNYKLSGEARRDGEL